MIAKSVAALVAVVAAYGLGTGAFMVWSGRAGKLRTRDRLLDRIARRGDEAVFDAISVC